MTEKQIKYCPNCGTQFVPPQKFCMECGQRLPQSRQNNSKASVGEEKNEERPLRGQSGQQTKAYAGSTTPNGRQQQARPASGRKRRVNNDDYQGTTEQQNYQSENPSENITANNETALWGGRAAVIIASLALVIGIFFRFNLFIAIVYVVAFFVSKHLFNHSVRLSPQAYRFYTTIWQIQKLVFTIMLVILVLHVGMQFMRTGLRTNFGYAVSNIYWPTGSVLELLNRLFQLF